MSKILMKAPRGKTSAQIEGHEYEIPESGVIEVRNVNHVPTLKRHGFVETDEQIEPDFEAMDDDSLIAYIEERGGEADDSMKRKKLLRLAREAYEEQKEA